MDVKKMELYGVVIPGTGISAANNREHNCEDQRAPHHHIFARDRYNDAVYQIRPCVDDVHPEEITIDSEPLHIERRQLTEEEKKGHVMEYREIPSEQDLERDQRGIYMYFDPWGHGSFIGMFMNSSNGTRPRWDKFISL